MRTVVRMVGLLAILGWVTGCATMDREAETAQIQIRTLIDGSDTIFIRGDQLWYVHEAYDLPGRWGGGNEPTYVNGEKWIPVWHNQISERYVIPDKDAALPPRRAFDENSLKVVAHGGWGQVAVTQYPNAENEHTLAIDIDDRGPDGASWYRIYVEWVED